MNSIKSKRRTLGYTQSELAKKTNVSPNTIWRIENEEALPSLKLLLKIAAALNCTVDELLKEE